MSATGGSPSRIEISPKKSPRPSVARCCAVDDDRGLAVEDHVEGRAGQALAQDPLAVREDLPPRTCGRPPRAAASSGRRTGRSPAIWSTISSRVAIERRTPPASVVDRIMTSRSVPDPFVAVPPRQCPAERPDRPAAPSLTRARRDAQHHEEPSGGSVTLTIDRRTQLLRRLPAVRRRLARRPRRDRRPGDRGRLPGRPRDRPPGRDRDRVLRGDRGRTSGSSADGEELARLGAGDFFGEMSVIDGLPRVAQVVTVEPTRCLALASWEFERLILDHPTIGLAILRGLSARLRSKTDLPRTERSAGHGRDHRATGRCRPGRSPSSSPTSRARPRLAQSLGTERWRRSSQRHRELIRAAVAAHGGIEDKTEGDGVLRRLPRTSDAVAAAVDAQKALAAEPWPDDAADPRPDGHPHRRRPARRGRRVRRRRTSTGRRASRRPGTAARCWSRRRRRA